MRTKHVIWLGSKKDPRAKHMPHIKIVWNPNMFKILGIWFTQGLKECEAINYNSKFHEVKKLFRIWTQRTITSLVSVAILKSLILPKNIHLWMLLPDPPDSFVNDLQDVCFEFAWMEDRTELPEKRR